MNETKKQVTENPNRDDVHEQREPDQPREGVVEKKPKPAEQPPTERGQKMQPER